MSKLNILVYLNAYRDSNPTNNPSLNNFRWQRDLQGIDASKPQSLEFCLAPGESRIMFDGERILLSDLTTEYSLSLKAGSTYVLTNTAGAAPAFRTLRATGQDSTTEVDIVVSGSLMTVSSSGGTDFDMSSVVIGDELFLGSTFLSQNQGRFMVLSKTATSVTVENPSAAAEAGVLLTDPELFRIYSSAGVQKGDKIQLGSGFSLSSQGVYEVTGVQDNLIEFFSAKILSPETGLLDPDVTIYSSAKKLIYVEADKNTSVQINGQEESRIEPFINGNNSKPGILMKRSTMWSMVLTNNSSEMSTLYFISVE